MDINIDTAVSFLDIFIILVLIWAIFKGYKRGPIVQAVSLLIILVGIALFGAISESIAKNMNTSGTLENLDMIIFSILFSVTIWLANFISNKVDAGGAAKPKGIVSVLLGILASVAKYLYILSILLLFFAQIDKSYNLSEPGKKGKTKFYYTVKSIAPTTITTVRFLEE